MAKLKKCPFCGWGTIVEGGILKHYWECNSCHARTDGYVTQEEATEAWNSRVNEFDEDKYEKTVLAEMERKHTEQQLLLSELKAVLPTTTEAEIRAKAIDEFAEKLKESFTFTNYFEGKCFKEHIDKLAEQLKEG